MAVVRLANQDTLVTGHQGIRQSEDAVRRTDAGILHRRSRNRWTARVGPQTTLSRLDSGQRCGVASARSLTVTGSVGESEVRCADGRAGRLRVFALRQQQADPFVHGIAHA